MRFFLLALLLTGTASALTLECTVVDGTAPTPTPTPPPVTQPKPEPPQTSCQQAPKVKIKTFDLYRNAHRDDGSKDETVSYRFVTDGSTAYGNISVASLLPNAYHTAWISDCPGEIPVTALGDRCVAQSYEAANLGWWQGNKSPEAWRCLLKPNSTYYLNVRHANRANIMGTTCSSTQCRYRIQTGYRRQ